MIFELLLLFYHIHFGLFLDLFLIKQMGDFLKKLVYVFLDFLVLKKDEMVVNLVDLMEECYALQIEDILVAVDLYYYLAYCIGVDYCIDFEEVYYFHFEEIAAADYCYCCIDFEEIDYIDLEDFLIWQI